MPDAIDHCLDIFFPYVAAVVDRCRGLIDASMTKFFLTVVEKNGNQFFTGRIQTSWIQMKVFSARKRNNFKISLLAFLKSISLQTCALSIEIF